MKIEEMNDDDRLKLLGLIIQRLVNNYVDRRAEKKTGIKIAEFPTAIAKNKDGEPLKKKNGKDLRLPVYTKEFRQTQQRVCTDAFLGMRSRHDQDFIEFFAGTICSLDPPLTADNLQFLIHVLRTLPDPNPVGEKRLSWEDVKAIAMIAVSARSFQVRPRETETPRSPS
jgi:CRISPR-associated protein Cmx8